MLQQEELEKLVKQEGDFKGFAYNGYQCEIKRQMYGGHLCGYVILPKGHSLFGKQYEAIDVDVHGGLTYSKHYLDYWIIGFDCAHSWDIVPNRDTSWYTYDCVYRDMGYVERELKSLVDQIINLDKKENKQND